MAAIVAGEKRVTEYLPAGSYRTTRCSSAGIGLETQTVEGLPTRTGKTKLRVTKLVKRVGPGRLFVNAIDYDQSENSASPASASRRMLAPLRRVSPQGKRVARTGEPFQGEQSADPHGRRAAIGDSCSNGQYTYVGGEIYTQYYPYHLNPNGIPGGGTNAVVAGHNAWNNTYNDCAFPDVTNINAAWSGYTQALPAMNDGVNVVYFGSVQTYCWTNDVLACTPMTAVSSNGGPWYFTDIDQVYRPSAPWSTNGSPAWNQYDLQGVAAHESGHAVGLDHAGSQYLTMFSSIAAGQTYTRTLGYGDARGLRCRYGVTYGGC